MFDVNQTEISIQNVKLSSKMKQVECQANNGYGATSSRVFKIDIKRNNLKELYSGATGS